MPDQTMSMLWKEGTFIPAQARIHPQDRGLLLGDGVFETVRVEGLRPCFASLHKARLSHGLQACGFAGVSLPDIATITAQLNDTSLWSGEDYTKLFNSPRMSLRLTVTRGPVGRGLAPTPDAYGDYTVLVSLAELASGSEKMPIHAQIATQRLDAQRHDAGYKSTGGYGAHLAARQAAAQARRQEAVMCNQFGRVVGASCANIFVAIDARNWITPPLYEGALPGVARHVILQEAVRCGITVIERPIAVSELDGAAIGISNVLYGVRPLYLEAKPDDNARTAVEQLQACFEMALQRQLQDND